MVPPNHRGVREGIVRQCGTCSLCCEIPPVPSIGKPANHKCFFWSSGCTLYPNHPGQCKAFECLWLQNPRLPEQLQPHRCGVLFEVHRIEKFVLALVDPFRPRAAEGYWPTKMIRRMLRDGYVVWIVVGSNKRMFLPKGVTQEEARRKVEAAWRRNGSGDIRNRSSNSR